MTNHDKRKILLAVTGLSPQIVTETLYALAVGQDTPWIPDEIHLITSCEGAERARLSLLDPAAGQFHALCRDYPQLATASFPPDNIHLIRDRVGQPLGDIRTPEDNALAADTIHAVVRALTADPDTELHVSIAGGRKTMGFFLGYALSLFGRPQDRLSHVLVSEPFENSWAFFYPTPYENIIETAGKKLIDTQSARLSLAEIPFVSLRHGLPTALLDGSARFDATVAAAQASLGPARLLIDLATRQVQAAGHRFRLPPAALALLAVFARRAATNEAALAAPLKDVPDPAWAERYLHELRAIVGPLGDIGSAEHALRAGMDGSYFSFQLSKLRSAIRRALGPAAEPYLIDDGGRKPRRYRLALAPEAVQLRA